jgi:hypothetical protein
MDFEDNFISVENWSLLYESLKAHPNLTSLDVDTTGPRSPGAGDNIAMMHDQKAHRTRLLADMVQHNTVLHTIHLPENERHKQIYTSEINPRLETNLYRPRVLIAWLSRKLSRDHFVKRYLVGLCNV